jgi:hypothetical protein
MTLLQLRDRCNELLISGVPTNAECGSRGHYGEFDAQLDGLYTQCDKQGRTWIELFGMPCSYPDPD